MMIGVAHADFGEGVVAVVTPVAGATLPSEAEIIAHLATRLAHGAAGVVSVVGAPDPAPHAQHWFPDTPSQAGIRW